MARFRRKSNVQWCSVAQDGNQVGTASYQQFAITFAGLTAAHTDITTNIPLIPDAPGTAFPAQISDLTGRRGYRLKRVVGKLFMQLQTLQNVQNIVVGAGLMVRRVDPSTGLPTSTLAESSVLQSPNLTDPWIWRRVWILGGDTAGVSSFSTVPSDNFLQSGLDGPHIDTKGARKVQEEERLFLTVSAINSSLTGATPTTVNFLLDMRVLISPLTMYGNRGNTVR